MAHVPTVHVPGGTNGLQHFTAPCFRLFWAAEIAASGSESSSAAVNSYPKEAAVPS